MALHPVGASAYMKLTVDFDGGGRLEQLSVLFHCPLVGL